MQTFTTIVNTFCLLTDKMLATLAFLGLFAGSTTEAAPVGPQGLYCTTHTLLGQTAEVRIKFTPEEFSFRIDRDMHWAWCEGIVFLLITLENPNKNRIATKYQHIYSIIYILNLSLSLSLSLSPSLPLPYLGRWST